MLRRLAGLPVSTLWITLASTVKTCVSNLYGIAASFRRAWAQENERAPMSARFAKPSAVMSDECRAQRCAAFWLCS